MAGPVYRARVNPGCRTCPVASCCPVHPDGAQRCGAHEHGRRYFTARYIVTAEVPSVDHVTSRALGRSGRPARLGRARGGKPRRRALPDTAAAARRRAEGGQRLRDRRRGRRGPDRRGHGARAGAGAADRGARPARLRPCRDIRNFFITHIHQDHYTLAVELRTTLRGQISLGEGERVNMAGDQGRRRRPGRGRVHRDAARRWARPSWRSRSARFMAPRLADPQPRSVVRP